MAWSAIRGKILPASDTGKIEVEIIFSDGNQNIHRKFQLEGRTLEGFKAEVRSALGSVSVGDDTQIILKTFQEGEVMDVTSGPPPDPSPEEVARREYRLAVDRVLRAQPLINAGIWKSDDPFIVALVDAAIALKQPEYL